MNPHASFACQRSKRNADFALFDRSKSSRNLFAASCVQTPNRTRSVSATASRA